MPRTALTSWLYWRAGSVTDRASSKNINWPLLALLLTLGLALWARDWVMTDAINARAAKAEVYDLEKELSDYKIETKIVHDRLIRIEAMQIETRNDVKAILKEMK